MAHTTASRYELDVETYLSGTLGMTAYPADFDSVSQVLAPATEYFSVLVQQAQIIRDIDSNTDHVELSIRLQLFYRFVTNEAEYTGSSSTPSKLKAALKVFMDERFWAGTGGAFTLTAPLDVQEDIEPPESTIERFGRVIRTEIKVTLVTTSV